MAEFVVLRAAFGYLFLVLMVRVVGRKPGKQLTPFEFVLIFYLGGLTLTGMVGDEMSLTNAVCQILTVGVCHYALSLLRYHSTMMSRLLDGVPLILLEQKRFRAETLANQHIQDDDVMDMARDAGLRNLDQIDRSVLETYGEISILPVEEES